MRILYLTLEPALDPGETATGNQLRAAVLMADLGDAGHEPVQHTQPQWTQNDIARRIQEVQPDAILLGYWQLTEQLPADIERPVVIDCIAPRPLEAHFVDPLATPDLIQRYTRALSRGDLILAGNARQRILLAGWMLAAGEDLRRRVPIVEVPLAVDAPEQPRSGHGSPLRLVTGGQDWAWRDASGWLAELADPQLQGAIELHHFGARTLETDAVEHGLVAWQEWQAFLAEQADVGVELAEPNLERELAQPFRIASFLQAGLPLLINDCLPLAEKVREYDAGWAVNSPQAARDALREAIDQPEAWRQKARGAQRLARDHFGRNVCSRPLLEWLNAPHQRHTPSRAATPTRSATLERQPSLPGMLVRLLLRPIRRDIAGDGVVVITRSDLFPTDHGAAVKIVETARGLAQTGRAVAIVTAECGRY